MLILEPLIAPRLGCIAYLGVYRNHQNRVPTRKQEVSNFQKPGTEINQEVEKIHKPVTETLPRTKPRI